MERQVKCPECGESISILALCCPRCGFPAVFYFGSPLRAKVGEGELIYECVASNPDTPIPVLAVLSKDSDWGVRAAVARNPCTPVGLLWVLSEDDDEEVRASVARNGNVPIPILEKLVGDWSPEVRNAIAGNLGTPSYILLALEEAIESRAADDDVSDGGDCGHWDDGWASFDPRELPEGYYEGSEGGFYIDFRGRKHSVRDYDGYLTYYDESNGAWMEI